MKESIPCKPDCPIDLDLCGNIHLLNGKFPCQTRETPHMTDEELEIFTREYLAFIKRLKEVRNEQRS